MNHESRKLIVSANLIIEKNNKLLLLKRSEWAPVFGGYWHCVTGKIENNETPKQAIIREAYEEVGLIVEPELVCTTFNKVTKINNPDKIYEDICLFFCVKDLLEAPFNKEPHLHSSIEWFDIDNLPSPIIPVVEHGINCYRKNLRYSDFEKV